MFQWLVNGRKTNQRESFELEGALKAGTKEVQDDLKKKKKKLIGAGHQLWSYSYIDSDLTGAKSFGES